MSLDMNELRNLPIADKLRIVEMLWDDIVASNEPIALHTWQFDEATHRQGQLRSDPSIAIDRDELWRRVDG